MSSDSIDDTRRTWQALKALTKDRNHWLNRNHGFSELADPSEETQAETIRLIEAAVAEGSGILDKAARLRPMLNGLALNELTAFLAELRVGQLILDADEGMGSEQATDPLTRDEPDLARPRGPGRPGWTRELFRRHYREAWNATPEPRTDPAVATRFRALDGEIGMEPGSLSRLRRKYRSG